MNGMGKGTEAAQRTGNLDSIHFHQDVLSAFHTVGTGELLPSVWSTALQGGDYHSHFIDASTENQNDVTDLGSPMRMKAGARLLTSSPRTRSPAPSLPGLALGEPGRREGGTREFFFFFFLEPGNSDTIRQAGSSLLLPFALGTPAYNLTKAYASHFQAEISAPEAS